MTVLPGRLTAPAATRTRIDATAAQRRRARRRRLGSAGAYAALLVAVFLSLAPLLWALLISIKRPVEAFSIPPVWSFTPTSEAYSVLWGERGFGEVLVSTLFVASICIVVSVFVAALAGYALARYTSVGSYTLLIGALVFRALPRMAVVLPFYYIARETGLYDTHLLLIIVLVAVNQPFTIWLLRDFFAAIPRELEEAAMVDGCTRFGAYWRVVLPLIRPGLITAAVFTGLLAYQEYLIVVILTQSTAVTVPVFITQFSTENITDWPIIASGSVSLALPIVFVMFFAQRYLIAGLTGGAVKG